MVQGQSVIRVDVIGVGRGSRFARGADASVGMELVALCDSWEEKLMSVANDQWSPNPADAAPGQPLPSILGDVEPAPDAVTYAREIWAAMGYTEQ